MKIELVLSIVGLVLAMSGFNIASAIHSFIKNRIDLIKELNAIRQGCKDDTTKLENLARTKINKIVGAIKSLSNHQQEIVKNHNEIAENLFQVVSFLESKHDFKVKKTSPDTIDNVNPFNSLELDFQVTEEGEHTK
jgi:predicted PurR-regulated permease PerM